MARRSLAALAVCYACVVGGPARTEVITRLPTTDKVVALTFDACEGRGKPAYLDQKLVGVLEHEKVPFTIFATGLFAQRNEQALRRLAALPQVEIENHSFSHPQHMERLDDPEVAAQLADADRIIAGITGKSPKFFRFPAGNYDRRVLADVEATGHRVVHWRFPSGDPAPGLTAQRLTQWVLYKVRPGDVLIFHINGRAPETADAMPGILAALRAQGYDFVRLDQGLP